MTGDTQGEQHDVIESAMQCASVGVSNAWREFRDHFDVAGEDERIRRKAQLFAEVMANTPGLQGSIEGFIQYLKDTKYGEDS